MSQNQPMSTYQDIVEMVPSLRDQDGVAQHRYVLTPLDIRSRILTNDTEIRSLLKPIYGSGLEGTPYLSSPVSLKNNQGVGNILPKSNSAQLALDPTINKSLVYLIQFTSDKNFEASTELTGVQGTGDVDTLFTSSDGFLTIDPTLWKGHFIEGDEFFLKVYVYEGLLVLLSSLLTAANILDSVYSEQSPNVSATAERYQRRYDQLMSKLLSGELELDGSVEGINLDPIQVDYEISSLGTDETNYAEDEWPRRRGGW